MKDPYKFKEIEIPITTYLILILPIALVVLFTMIWYNGYQSEKRQDAIFEQYHIEMKNIHDN